MSKNVSIHHTTSSQYTILNLYLKTYLIKNYSHQKNMELWQFYWVKLYFTLKTYTVLLLLDGFSFTENFLFRKNLNTYKLNPFISEYQMLLTSFFVLQHCFIFQNLATFSYSVIKQFLVLIVNPLTNVFTSLFYLLRIFKLENIWWYFLKIKKGKINNFVYFTQIVSTYY